MKNPLLILWQSQRKLILVGILSLAMLALVIVYLFMRQAFPFLTRNPYDPARFGVPSSLGGYKVLAVFAPDNLACMNPGEIRLVLQATEPNVGQYLANSDPQSIQKDLKQRGLTATIQIVGPGVTIGQIIRESARWNQDMKQSGCVKLGPAGDSQSTTGP